MGAVHGTLITWLSRLAPARPDPQAAEKILALPCALCGAAPGEPCDPWSPAASLALPPCGLCGDPPRCPQWCDAAAGVTVIGGDPLVTVHTARVLAAAGAGTVSRRALLAQFAPGRAPYSLTDREDQEIRT